MQPRRNGAGWCSLSGRISGAPHVWEVQGPCDVQKAQVSKGLPRIPARSSLWEAVLPKLLLTALVKLGASGDRTQAAAEWSPLSSRTGKGNERRVCSGPADGWRAQPDERDGPLRPLRIPGKERSEVLLGKPKTQTAGSTRRTDQL